jgi:putative FmdB family regulatory protein
MPIYEYECEKCLIRFEEKRHFGEDGGASCPECQSEARRIFSPVPIIFKGPGFYVTDNATQRWKQSSKQRDKEQPAETEKSTPVTKESKDEVAS